MYSFSSFNLPSKFDILFSLHNRTHSYNTGIHFLLAYHIAGKTNIRQFSVFFQSPKCFNALSSDITSSTSIASFQKKLNDFFIENGVNFLTYNFFSDLLPLAHP